ncbi:hypothetical protein ACS0TY_022325 [Phlomoides rotata]
MRTGHRKTLQHCASSGKSRLRKTLMPLAFGNYAKGNESSDGLYGLRNRKKSVLLSISLTSGHEGVGLIAAKCGEILEVDKRSLEGLSRSVRIKVNVDLTKPLKKGIQLEIRDSQPIWAGIKYECLPSFCFFCDIIGHMRKECDLVDGSTDLRGVA